MRATFANRLTAIESLPVGLTPKFSDNEARNLQWAAFRKRGRFPHAPEELGSIVTAVASFAVPVLDALNGGNRFGRVWRAGGPWVDKVTAVDFASDDSIRRARNGPTGPE